MKNIFAAALIACGLIGAAFGQASERQEYRKISRIIADSEKVNGMFAGMLGLETDGKGNAEATVLSAVTFPNSVKVKFSGETRKIGKSREKAADKWLKEYDQTPGARQFYLNEILVEEDGAQYWIMAHESAVIDKIKDRKNETLILKMRILGFARKGAKADYYLLADGLQ